MTPLSYDDAYAATDPGAPEEERKNSALALQNGVLANEIYWRQHSDVVTALKAAAAGHGVVQRGEEAEAPAEVETSPDAPAVETTSGPAKEIAQSSDVAGRSPATAGTTESGAALSGSPENPLEAVARLRQQLRDHDLTPEA